MNKILHALVLVVFVAACWFLSLILRLPLMVQPAAARLSSAESGQEFLPAFTRLCMGVGPVLLAVLAFLALAYCIYVWLRKAERPMPCLGFLATSMSALVVVLLPTVVAIYIPLVAFLDRLPVTLAK